MTKDEALKLARRALYFAHDDGYSNELSHEAITAIKAALEAKDEPEYYGLTKDHLWMSISKEHYDRLKPEFRMTCYTTPPQRTWVGLTTEEREQVQAESYGKVPHHVALIATVEAKLKEKNGYD